MVNLKNFISETQQKIEAISEQASNYAQNWEKTGLLEGLKSQDKLNIATLLENQMKNIITESVTTNLGGSTFTAGAGEQWAGIALPMVRKIFAETISIKEMVSVQPMQLPTGLIFYLDFKYGTTKTPFGTSDSVYGTTDTENVDASGGLYGVGRYGYSINNASASVTGTVSSGSWADVYLNANLSASVAANEIKKVTVAVSGLADYDVNGVRAFTLSGSGILPSTVLNAFTDTDGTNVYFIVSGSSGAVTTGTTLCTYIKQTKDNFRSDFEDRTGSLTIPEFNLDPRSETVNAKTRKLKAKWTFEAMQDYKAYLSIDVEQEMTQFISDYVATEIDLEVLDMLILNTKTTEYWTADNNLQINAAKTAFVPMTSGFYNSQGQWFQTLGTKMQKVSNAIHQKTLRGGANFMVVSPTVATLIESIPGYAADTDGEKWEYAMGVQKVGTLNSRFKVFKNPYFTENIILMGFKGNNFLETGAAYCPYIPLMLTPLVYDPNTFTPSKGLITRYAKKVVRGEFYGKIVVGGLNTV